MGRYADHALADAASRVLALDIDELIAPSTPEDDESPWLSDASGMGMGDGPSAVDPFVRKQAERLLGCLLLAAEDTASALDHDLQQLQAGRPAHDDDRITVLWQLPPQFLTRYDAAFVERFLDSFVDLGQRLTRSPWDPALMRCAGTRTPPALRSRRPDRGPASRGLARELARNR